MRNFSIFKAIFLMAAIAATGCGGPAGGLNAGPTGGLNPSPALNQAAPVGHQAITMDDRKKPFAGTYHGSVSWSLSSGANTSSSLTTIVHFHNKNILGPFRFTDQNNTRHRFRLYGRIKSISGGEMYIAFAIYNTKGGYAVGNGTIANGTFQGRAKLNPGGGPSGSLSFTATKP